MRVSLARSVRISFSASACAPGQRERQRRDDFFRNAAIAGVGAAGRAPQLRPHQAERELAGEHFIEGEAHSRGRLRRDLLGRLRAMRAAQRLGE